MLVCLHSVCGCFHTATTELRSCDRERMVYRAKNTVYLITEKVCWLLIYVHIPIFTILLCVSFAVSVCVFAQECLNVVHVGTCLC